MINFSTCTITQYITPYCTCQNGFKLYGLFIFQKSRLSVSSKGNGLDDPRFKSQQKLNIFFYSKRSSQTLVPTKPPLQWVTGVIFLGAKWPWGEASDSSTLVAKLKMSAATPLHPVYTFTACKRTTLQLHPYFHASVIFSEKAVYLPLNTTSEKHAFSHSCVLTIDTKLSLIEYKQN